MFYMYVVIINKWYCLIAKLFKKRDVYINLNLLYVKIFCYCVEEIKNMFVWTICTFYFLT